MKILAIRLKNLASLAGEQVIDFTTEPLASAGLFAITGPTGAGKSTILDALCLALFGSTPRLQGHGAASKVPDGEDEIGSGDERTLLRRGCGSGYAEVDFLGVDGHRYRARWEANRARERADGRLQQSRQSLTNLDSGQLLASGKKREFREQLEHRLGLNLAQFTRAVLLAQSEFSAFLKADDNDRGTLLEKLTDTGLYSRLGQAAFEAAKRAREHLTQLEFQAGGLQPLDNEARQALEQRHDRLQGELKGLQQTLRTLEGQRQWLHTLASLHSEARIAGAQLQDAEAAHAALDDARRTLVLLDQLAPQRHRFARLAELAPLLDDSNAAVVAQGARQHALQQRLGELEAACQQARSRLGQAEQALQQAKPRLELARKEEERLGHLNGDMDQAREDLRQAEQAVQQGAASQARLQDQRQRLEQQLATLAEQLQHSDALHPLCAAWTGYRPRLQQAVQLANQLQRARGELPTLEQAAAAAEQQRQAARQALDHLHGELGGDRGLGEQLEAVLGQLGEWRPQQRGLEDLQRLWLRQQQLDEQARALQDAETAQQHERATLIETGQQRRLDLQAAERTLQVTLDLLERQRLARSANVEALRSALRDDEPCPVCGSREHPYHDGALLAAMDRHDQGEADRARQAVEQLKEQLSQLREQVAALNQQLKHTQQERQRCLVELQPLARDLAAQADYPALLAQAEGERRDWLERQLAELGQRIQRAESEQSRLLTHQHRAERLREQWQSAHDAYLQASQQRDRQRQDMQRDGQQLEQALEEFAALLPGEVRARWPHAASECFAGLEAQVTARLAQLEQQMALGEEQRQQQASLEREQLQQQHRQAQRQRCGQRLDDLILQQQGCRQSLRQCLGDQPGASAWQQHLEQAIATARGLEADAGQRLQEAGGQLIKCASELQSAQRRRDELQAESATLQLQLEQWRQQHPAFDDATLSALLEQDEAQVKALRTRLRQSDEVLAQCRTRLEERRQRLAEHQALQPDALEPTSLEQRLAETQRDLELAEQQCAECRAERVADDLRRTQSSELSQRIAMAHGENQRWGRLSALIGSADGGAFRKIAQAYNLDLLVQHSNVQLRQLARRYRLKRGGSPLGLLVMDTEMGDELRSVHSLSGGETFLVSLALALGLASMASSKLKIESLFIDEGFGSLDPESLQVAMDALDCLQAQGRKVAVISHVQEMHERIPVQIQVRRQGNGQSGLRIVGGALLQTPV